MPTSAPTAILADLNPDCIRFVARPAEHGPGDMLPEPDSSPLDAFQSDDPLAEAVQWFADENDIALHSAHLFLAVPAPVVGDRIEIGIETMAQWSFSKSGLRAKLGLLGLDVLNDIFAAALSIPEALLAGQYERIGAEGSPVEGYPLLIVAARPGIGAAALVPIVNPDPSNAEPVWFPVSGDIGELPLVPVEADREIMKLVSKEMKGQFETANDYVSGRGIADIYRGLAGLPLVEETVVSVEEIADWAASKGSKQSADARRTIEIWCAMFGLFVRSLVLTYGARGGVYLTGSFIRAFLGDAGSPGRKLFRERLDIHRMESAETYLESTPVYFLSNPNPYLMGLSRLKPGE